MTEHHVPACLHPLESVQVRTYENGIHVYCRLCRRDLQWITVSQEDEDEAELG